MTDFTPPPLADFGRRLCGKRGVDRVEGRDDKLEQQEGNCWKNVQVGKARSRGPGTEKGWRAQQCARPGEGHNQHQPLGGETTALLCSTNDDPDSSRCKLVQERERWRCCLKSGRQIGWQCWNQHLVASFVSESRFHNSRAVSQPPWTMLDNKATGDLVTRLSTSLNQLSSVFSAFFASSLF